MLYVITCKEMHTLQVRSLVYLALAISESFSEKGNLRNQELQSGRRKIRFFIF